jgi:hypothetical protein
LPAAASIRFQAWSRSSSVTPSTWSNRAIAFRTCRASLMTSFLWEGKAKSASGRRSFAAVLSPSELRGMSSPCARSLWTSRAFSMLRRAASFCLSVAMARTSKNQIDFSERTRGSARQAH